MKAALSISFLRMASSNLALNSVTVSACRLMLLAAKATFGVAAHTLELVLAGISLHVDVFYFITI